MSVMEAGRQLLPPATAIVLGVTLGEIIPAVGWLVGSLVMFGIIATWGRYDGP